MENIQLLISLVGIFAYPTVLPLYHIYICYIIICFSNAELDSKSNPEVIEQKGPSSKIRQNISFY